MAQELVRLKVNLKVGSLNSIIIQLFKNASLNQIKA